MKVKAKSMGQYQGRMKELGEIFELDSKDKLEWWMEQIEPAIPAKPAPKTEVKK